MRKSRVLLLVSIIALLIACGEPVIDASTNDSMSKSYDRIYDSLSDEKREEFKFAYGSIVNSYRTHRAFRTTEDTKETIHRRLESAIQNKNADQILEEFRKVRKTRGLWEIQRIEKQIAKLLEDKKQLERVEIDKYKLYMDKDGMLDRIFLDAVISNGSIYNLTSAVFTIRIGSSFSNTLLPQKRTIYFEFPEGLGQGSEIATTIDLGQPTFQRYLPRDPVLSEHSISRISGEEIDISAIVYPKVSDLEKTLMTKKNDYKNEFGEDGY